MIKSSLKVFLDSDVIISSLISSAGAAFLLLNSPQKTHFYLSNFSLKELETVVKRLNLDPQKLHHLVKKLHRVELGSLDIIKTDFENFCLDPNDAHIVAGAVQANAKFLISYNLKDFKTDKIKDKLSVQVLTPALFLQYLRSRKINV